MARTDAGVHAKVYLNQRFYSRQYPPRTAAGGALNARLPGDVVVQKAFAVPSDFDARFSCVAKKNITYFIYNGRVKNPFYLGRAGFYPIPLDERAMSEAAKLFVGERDFAAVRNQGTPVKSTIRRVDYCLAERRGELIIIRVCANGFLYNLVRSIAGTLVYVGAGKLMPDDIPEMLLSGDREKAGPTLPPDGLYLTALRYGRKEIDDWLREREDYQNLKKTSALYGLALYGVWHCWVCWAPLIFCIWNYQDDLNVKNFRRIVSYLSVLGTEQSEFTEYKFEAGLNTRYTPFSTGLAVCSGDTYRFITAINSEGFSLQLKYADPIMETSRRTVLNLRSRRYGAVLGQLPILSFLKPSFLPILFLPP